LAPTNPDPPVTSTRPSCAVGVVLELSAMPPRITETCSSFE
jgi:hypothetical protein